MDKKNSKNLKSNKNQMNNSNSRVEFADDISSNTSKKASKHNTNKHSDCNSSK
ncbi:hypothetical protein [uncultured Tyzzerella sp.]|uniref:hypothetical protein n=1 Tax=uncultured Tyzzerella sp. TaxID=2321398 RepID=UPI00294341BB|nr:hypothetical protein [uncultured Tyzzerella sp.]